MNRPRAPTSNSSPQRYRDAHRCDRLPGCWGQPSLPDRDVPADLATLFPGQEPPILATWITGELRCPEGGLRSYRHAGFGSEYERDRLIDVVDGSVVGEWLRLNPPEPILYRIDAAGVRTRVADYGHDAEPLDDPFAPDEVPKGHVFWGRPEDFGDSDGYEIWGYYRGSSISAPGRSV